jgi:hypothetical protein
MHAPWLSDTHRAEAKILPGWVLDRCKKHLVRTHTLARRADGQIFAGKLLGCERRDALLDGVAEGLVIA